MSAASAQGRPRIVLDSVTPSAPGPGDTLRVSGTFDNSHGARQPDVSMRLRLLHSPLTRRGQVANYATDPDGPTGLPVYGYEDEVGDVAAGAARQFDLKVPVEELGISEFGVYLIAVEALSGYAQVAVQRTYIVYVPDGRVARPDPTRISWLWPVVDRPHQLLGNTFRNERLTPKLTGNGRLARLVRAGASASSGKYTVPLTWVIDPNLLGETARMRDGYRVRSGARTVRGTGSVQADTFLTQLDAATRDAPVLSLPYADVDVAALARSDLDDDIALAVTQGQEITEATLDVETAQNVAWPPDGLIDQAGLDALAAGGSHAVILQDTALPPTETLTYTPNPIAQTETATGDVEVLLSDHVITDILDAPKKPGSATLTEQRFLAETALITAERPNDARGLVVAPPRRWDPPLGLPGALLRDTAKVPWLKPTSLAEQRQGKPSSELSRGQLTYPDRARRAELSQRYLDGVQELHESLGTFSELFTGLPERVTDYKLAALRAESSAWRRHPKSGRALLRSTTAVLTDKKRKVHLLPPGRLSLASSEGPLPLTIENNLSVPVTVNLRVWSDNPARMRLSDVPKSITVPPNQKVTQAVHAEFVATGVAHAQARLVTVGGTPYGERMHFSVLSTAYGTVAIAITAAALVVLFAGSGYRIVKRVRRARRSPGRG